MTTTDDSPKDEKSICPFCLTALPIIDWDKLILILNGYDEEQFKALTIIFDHAYAIIQKERSRRASMEKYEKEAAPLLDSKPSVINIMARKLPPNIKQFSEKVLFPKWAGDKKCPICKHQYWIANDMILQLMQWQQKNVLAIGAPVQPVISLICKNCGYTIFFNAMISGVIEPPFKPPGGT